MKLTKKIIDGEDVYFENGVKKYTHSKNSDGFEWWRERDSNNNVTHFKYNEGVESWSDTHPNNPKNKVEVEVDIEPFTFNKK